ncbi:MAG: DUF2973 domain-containing protein [Cyanobacteriota bacterium]
MSRPRSSPPAWPWPTPRAEAPRPRPSSGNRLGKITIHPELLDADGQITREDLLTVRFSDDSGEPVRPAD